MAAHIGCEHKELYFDPGQQLRSFRTLLATYGEPIMLLPLIHTYELCRAIRADGASGNVTGRPTDHHQYTPASADRSSTSHTSPCR